jgi:hypothetical protein
MAWATAGLPLGEWQIEMTSPFFCTLTTKVSCGSRISCTSATTRHVGSTYLLSTSTMFCTYLAVPIVLTSSRAGGSSTARGQPSPLATTTQALHSSSMQWQLPSPMCAPAPTPPARAVRPCRAGGRLQGGSSPPGASDGGDLGAAARMMGPTQGRV